MPKLSPAGATGGGQLKVPSNAFVREDGVVTGALAAVNNLSDLDSVTAAVANLGLGDAALLGVDTTASDIQPTGTQSAGGTVATLAAYSDHIHPAAEWVPADSNLLLATWDPATTPSTGILAAGTLYLVKLNIRYALTITYLWWQVSSAGTGTSAGSYTGLYSSSGALLTGSADLVTPMTTQEAAKCALTTPQALTAGQSVWAALLVNLQTTQPTMGQGLGNNGLLANAGITSAAAYRFATNSPAATTVASGSNGGEISAIASWSSPSAGVLDVASTTGYPSSGGSLAVAASGSTLAEITYTGISGSSFTGCAYVSGSASGTVATGGAVSMASLPSSITPSNNALTTRNLWAGGS
jgi:hypothetical protein